MDWIESWVPRDLSTIDCRAARTSVVPQMGQVGVRSRIHDISHAWQVTVMVSEPGTPSRLPRRSSSSPQAGQAILVIYRNGSAG